MTKHFIFLLMAILLLAESGAAQTLRKQTTSELRAVDRSHVVRTFL